MHENIVYYRRGRYFWVALALLIISLGVYLSQADDLPPNGGTWQGYTLGGISAALMLWLSFLGFRKRSYRSRLGTVQGWTSSHVYLGAVLLVIALLHGAFQFGINVSTLLFVLMAAVIATGFVGLFVYLADPRRLARVRAGRRRKDWLTELNEIDTRLRELGRSCEANTRAIVESAIDRTALGGGVIAQLRGTDHSRVLDPENAATSSRLVANPDQDVVIDYLADAIPKAQKSQEALTLQELLWAFGRRRTVLQRLREDIRLQARLQFWLYLHIPLTVGALAALSVHVVSVFIYW